MKRLLFVFLFLSIYVFSQDSGGVFHLDSTLGLINQNWKYHKGDDINWASASFDDSKWENIPSNFNLGKIPAGSFENIGWFRMHIAVDTSLVNKTICLMLSQAGASEIYLDGKLIHKFGIVDPKNTENEERFDPLFLPVDIRFENVRNHVLAVRYSNSKAIRDFKKNDDATAGFKLKTGKLRRAVEEKYINSNIVTSLFIFYFTFFIALSFLHFTFFFFYKANKSNLYYAIFSLAFGSTFIWLVVQQNFLYPDVRDSFTTFGHFLPDIYCPALLAVLYNIFNKKIPKIFWLWFALYFIDFSTTILNIDVEMLGWINMSIFALESLRIIIVSLIKKREGAWILGSGIIVTVLFFTLFFVLSAISGNIDYSRSGWLGLVFGLLAIYATLSIPVSMTVYLARDFARTSKNLEKKLIEVEELSEKTIEQEKEKQQILSNQNVTLEHQVRERTSEIVEQKKVIEEKNKDITDSINYAKRIQEAMLPARELKYRLFPEAFILFKPKDIVSGDFYWFAEKNGKKLIAAADCTGHGVPGALMSMIGNNMLNQIVNEKGITSPDEVLNNLHKEVRSALKQHEQSENKDGMDIAFCTFTNDKNLEYAGANRPLWIVNGQTFTEIKADKVSIGGTQRELERKFTKHSLTLNKGDCVYIFSDGYADQFGGSEEKKFMTRKLKELLVTICEKPLDEQESILEKTLEEWKGNFAQVDDILVIGIRI